MSRWLRTSQIQAGNRCCPDRRNEEPRFTAYLMRTWLAGSPNFRWQYLQAQPARTENGQLRSIHGPVAAVLSYFTCQYAPSKFAKIGTPAVAFSELAMLPPVAKLNAPTGLIVICLPVQPVFIVVMTAVPEIEKIGFTGAVIVVSDATVVPVMSSIPTLFAMVAVDEPAGL